MNDYEKPKPLIPLFALVTDAGNRVSLTRNGAAASMVIADAENLMTGQAKTVNPFLHDVQDAISREKVTLAARPNLTAVKPIAQKRSEA